MRDARTRGETPLHRAAAVGTEETIDLLLGAGARVDARDAHGDTPLSWGSWYARPDAILRKLCCGAHRIHPDRKPMAVSLQGCPAGRARPRAGPGDAQQLPAAGPVAARVGRAYLAGLPMERRAAIEAVRRLVRHRLPGGYRETLAWGGITYEVPLKRYPDTYGHRGQEPGLSRASRRLTAAG